MFPAVSNSPPLSMNISVYGETYVPYQVTNSSTAIGLGKVYASQFNGTRTSTEFVNMSYPDLSMADFLLDRNENTTVSFNFDNLMASTFNLATGEADKIMSVAHFNNQPYHSAPMSSVLQLLVVGLHLGSLELHHTLRVILRPVRSFQCGSVFRRRQIPLHLPATVPPRMGDHSSHVPGVFSLHCSIDRVRHDDDVQRRVWVHHLPGGGSPTRSRVELGECRPHLGLGVCILAVVFVGKGDGRFLQQLSDTFSV
ncbi:putative ATP-binding cassette sub-family A member 3 [Apostichopus japonicus]|uniref:Putative ATP-binding cassette sub-family A member 3 n=1 Tax=Stichopus japonicus TaxID=307972 RepID=A0A2G8LBE7_STIJA|nr:putative ATP-binding cassette sub-family A member 3 [Apostichopus japonicus]